MPKFKTFFNRGKTTAIQKSIEGRQEKAKKLLDKLQWLYDTIIITPSQSDAIKMLHVQYTQRSRELMEEYTQKEIDILEDKESKYRLEVEAMKCLGCSQQLDFKNFYKDASGGIWCNDCWFKGLKNK